jgi:uroporphyrinogen-III synthase
VILLPRPQPHLVSSLAYLQAHGIADVLPLATSHPQPLPITIPPTATALFLTSMLALQAFKPHPQTLALPVYAVGPSTAQAARNLGYTVALQGDENAATLTARMVQANIPPQHILHLYGNNAPAEAFGAWQSQLKAHHHTITSVLAYQLNPISALTQQETAQLRQKHPTHTLLFSVGSTQHLANLLKQANIPCTGTAIALSPAVAKVAQHFWPRVVVAPNRTLDGMTKALEKETHT